MSDNPLTGEVSNSKLAAIFPMSASARSAAAALVAQLGFKPAQVKLITPDTADTDIKLEPESGRKRGRKRGQVHLSRFND